MIRFLITFLFIIVKIQTIQATQHVWNGGTGNYDDPTQWVQGTVPTATDDVLIESGTVIFPANGTYEAQNFSAESCTLDFKGQYSNSADIDIYGDLDIAVDVTSIYEAGSHSTWAFMGGGINHIVNVKSVDLNRIYIDEESSQIELATSLIAENSISFQNGHFDTNGYDILTGNFIVGGSCLPNCMTKYLSFSSSTITCTGLWRAIFNYGTVNISGTYTIKAAEFHGGVGIDYYNVELTDNSVTISTQAQQNLISRNNSFNNLTIDNIYHTKIAGSLTVNGSFEVVQPNSIIYLSKEPSGSTDQWTFNGSVDLPVDQGGCLDLTRFIPQPGVSDTFNFYSPSANLTFDYAYIQGIPTTGGGSFTVNTGYVAGYNSSWSTINPHPSKTLYWIGGTGDWHDGSHWALSSGGSGAGCPPSVVDDVIFDANSFTGPNQSINVSYDEINTCRDLAWIANPHDAQMDPIYLGSSIPYIDISGEIDIEVPVTIDMYNGGFNMIANDELSMSSIAVLPKLTFLSESGFYLVDSDLEVENIRFYAGGMETQDFDLMINGSWLSLNYQPKYYDLGNSTIIVNGSLKFGDIYDGNVTMNAGTSYLNCETFTGDNADYHIVEINTTDENQFTTPVSFQKLILNGATIWPTNSGITIDTLVLNADGSDFKLNPTDDCHITKTIISNAPGVDPPQIRPYIGTQATLVFEQHNPCLEGPISFLNVEAQNTGIVNATDGIDDGGNSGISFADPTYTGTLHWIGKQGYWNTLSNWSPVSGGCPTNVDPQNADQLIFDDNSFTSDDTIFINGYRTCKDLLFTNTNYETVLYLGRRLVPDKVEIDEGAVVVSNNMNVQPFGTLWADESVSVTNGGSLTLDNSDVIAARRPTGMGNEPALYVDFMSSLSGNFGSVVGIAGASSDVSIKSVDIQFGANISTNDVAFAIVPPISGEPLRDLKFDFSNRYFKKLSTDVTNTTQTYQFIDTARFGTIEHNHGTIQVSPPNTLRVDN